MNLKCLKTGKKIKIGATVRFRVENMDRWCGSGVGTLQYDNEFYIEDKSGYKAYFRKYLGVYENSLELINSGSSSIG